MVLLVLLLVVVGMLQIDSLHRLLHWIVSLRTRLKTHRLQHQKDRHGTATKVTKDRRPWSANIVFEPLPHIVQSNNLWNEILQRNKKLLQSNNKPKKSKGIGVVKDRTDEAVQMYVFTLSWQERGIFSDQRGISAGAWKSNASLVWEW